MKKFILLFISVLSLCSISSPGQWAQQASGTTNQLEEIFFPAADTGYVAGWNGTILGTTDGGNNWNVLNSGTINKLLDIFFLDSQTGFAVGDSGIFLKTTNGGNNWTMQIISGFNTLRLSSVFFVDSDTGFAGGSENFTNGIILKTTDGGSSWAATNIPSSFLSIDFQRINFPEPAVGYALTRGMCMKTIDGGNNWFVTDTVLVASGGMFSILEDCHFFSADTGYIVGWYNPFNGYTDDGYHWTDHFVGNNQWFAVEFPSRQTGYLAGWSEVYKTTDGGSTWNDITTPLVQNAIYSMSFTDENTGYACGANGLIIKTTTGGVTGVNSFEVNDAVKIFPNPSGGVFKLGVGSWELGVKEGVLQILNVLCEVAYERNMFLQAENEIDVSHFSAGVYSLSITFGEKEFRQKIIIQ